MITTYRHVAKDGSYATRWHNVPVEPPSTYYKKTLLGADYTTEFRSEYADQDQDPAQHRARLG